VNTEPLISGDYKHVLAAIHTESRPRTYLEIGMLTGGTLSLAEPATRVVGVDPLPAVWAPINADAQLFFEKSDDFFAGRDVTALLDGLPIDFAFIDGMHLFEFALRDFRNIERYAAPGSVVAVHDCFPQSAAWATRERQTDMWTGDTWKLVPCLAEVRPDLVISTIAAGPSGLALISNLDPTNRVLFDDYDEIVARFLPLEYDELGAQRASTLRLVPNEPDVVAGLVPRWPADASRAPVRKRYPRARRVFVHQARRAVAKLRDRVRGTTPRPAVEG
jgi:hypothetical protein